MEKPKNILVLTYWSFSDALVQTYTLPYLKIISRIISENSLIHLFTVEKKGSQPPPATAFPKINVQYGSYYPFGLRAIGQWILNLVKLLVFIKKNKITVIHCWCTPAGGLGYILSVLSGAELILDSYEPHAEAMVENGTWSKNQFAFKILWYLEKKQTRKAKAVIAATAGMKAYAKLKYKVDILNFYTKPACVDLETFSLDKKKNAGLLRELGLENKIIGLYAGKFGGIYLKEDVFQFFAEAWSFWGEKLKILLLTSQNSAEIMDLANRYKLPEDLFIIKYIEHRNIASYIGLADFAITPVKPVPTKRYCSPIKDGEYWAMGLPVLITENISDDSTIIEDNRIGYVWRSNTVAEYMKSVVYLNYMISDHKNELADRIRNIAKKHRNFSIAENVYREIYGKH